MSNDASILRSLGLMLAREEGTKRPVAVSPPRANAADAASEFEFACSWCQRERNEVPQAHQTHGICERHRAEMRREIELRRAA